MGCSIAELRNKEVICKLNGTRIGNVDDVELDINNGRLVSIIIYGKGKIMGVFGKRRPRSEEHTSELQPKGRT